MKIWVDNNERNSPPEGYDVLCNTTKETLAYISGNWEFVDEVSMPYKAEEYLEYGGNYINILKVLDHWVNNDHSRSVHWVFKFRDMTHAELDEASEIACKNDWKVLETERVG